MTQDVLGGSEIGERMGQLNPQPRARTLVALLAAIVMIVPATAFAGAPLSYIEQEADTFITRINTRYGEHLDSAAMLTDYDRDMLVSVIAVESEGNPVAASPVGARGLMQLMPGTAKHFGVKDLSDPFQNILAGAKYLKDLETNYGFKNSEEALIAYNMGPSRARRFLSQYETDDHGYVKRVKIVYGRIQELKEKERIVVLEKEAKEEAAKRMVVRPTPISSVIGKMFSPLKVAEASVE